MQLPRMTIKTFMVVAAIIAFDCAVFIEGTFSGLLVPVLALNLGLRLLTRAGDGGRRFWTGFVVTDLLAVAGYVALVYVAGEAIAQWPTTVLNSVISRVPGHAVEQTVFPFIEGSLLAQVTLLETTIGVPIVLLAVAGAWIRAALRAGRANRPASAEQFPAVRGPDGLSSAPTILSTEDP